MNYIRHDESDIPEEVVAAANRENNHYFVSLVSDSHPAGSATLVRIGDLHGLLTAAHVADLLTKSTQPEIGIIYSDRPHRMGVNKKYISIMHRHLGQNEDSGPDVAFIAVHDTEIVGQLKATKSFYPVEALKAAKFEEIQPPESRLCFLVGAPGEFWRNTALEDADYNIRSATHFSARAQVINRFSEGQFDFLDLSLISGSDGFPRSYGGVSGGGIWHIPLTMDDNANTSTIIYDKPELIGIAFYQFSGTDRRIIRAHGYRGLANLLQMAEKC